MDANVGSVDRSLRLVTASTLLWIVVLGLTDLPARVAVLLFAVGLILTAHHGECPIYRALGWSTRRSRPRGALGASS